MSDEYYTVKEAMERLGGIPAVRFYYLVRQGYVRQFAPPESRVRLYSKEDVDQMAEEQLLNQVQADISLETLLLKAYENAEIAYSRATGISLHLHLAQERLIDEATQATLTDLTERSKQVSKLLERLQFDISTLINQVKESQS